MSPRAPGSRRPICFRPSFGYDRRVRLTVATVIATLTIGGPSALAQGVDPLAPFKRALALQQSGDLEEAARAYREFLATYPNNIEARSNLGVVLAGLGRYEEAIEAYRLALAPNPSNSAVRLNLGIALYKAALFADAAKELGAVLAAQPANRQARYLEADCYLRLGEPKRAIELLAEYESSRTNDLALAYILGMAYLRAGETENGQVLIDRILRNGDSAEARLMMGVAKRGVQDLSGARDDLARAVELNPELPTVHAHYGLSLLETGDREQAREQFGQELKRNPLDYEANLHMGVILKEDSSFDAALEYFNRALRVRPGDVVARFQIAAVKVATAQAEAALPLLEAVVHEAPEFVEAHVLLATVYYRLQKREAGDRERTIIDELNKKRQANQPGAQPAAQQQPPGGF